MTPSLENLQHLLKKLPGLGYRSAERVALHLLLGVYHVLHGKLSPLQGVGPEQLNFESLEKRLAKGEVDEIILALSNDVEGEATCHFLTSELIPSGEAIKITRIGFGLPSGGGVLYADSVTLKSALEGRRGYE